MLLSQCEKTTLPSDPPEGNGKGKMLMLFLKNIYDIGKICLLKKEEDPLVYIYNVYK